LELTEDRDLTVAEMNELRNLCHWDMRRRAFAASCCDGKSAFKTQAAAERTMSERMKRDAHAYRCAVCHDWHIGNRLVDRRRRLERLGVK
jgi:hypothetical protein